MFFFFFQAEDGIRDLVRSRGLGDVYKRQRERQETDPVHADDRRAPAEDADRGEGHRRSTRPRRDPLPVDDDSEEDEEERQDLSPIHI